jgi:hypothetical protein
MDCFYRRSRSFARLDLRYRYAHRWMHAALADRAQKDEPDLRTRAYTKPVPFVPFREIRTSAHVGQFLRNCQIRVSEKLACVGNKLGRFAATLFHERGAAKNRC